MIAWWADPTLQTVAAGGAMVGGVCGSLGTFAYLRRQSLIGDVVAHSSLLGIMVAFLMAYWWTGSGSRSPSVLMPGAVVAGLAAAGLMRLLTGWTSLKEDAALGVMLAVFFATAMVLMRWIERVDPPIGGRAGLSQFLFGEAAATSRADLWWIGGVGLVAVGTMVLGWHRLTIYTFDPMHARGLGLPHRATETLMTALLVVGIVIGIQSMGVVLVVSMMTAPAAAARQWTRTVASMAMLAGAFGSGCATAGAVLSGTVRNVPTGPVIVLLLTLVFVISVVGSPSRGVVSGWIRRRRIRRTTDAMNRRTDGRTGEAV